MSSGVVLDAHYAYKYCAPSRAALLTGRTPGDGISELNPALPTAFANVPLNLTLLPQALRRGARYRTHHVGKWHLGFYRSAYLPIRRGFDTSLGYLGGAETHFSQSGGCSISNGRSCCENWFGPTEAQPPNVDLFEDGAPARGMEGQYGARMYADRALLRIREHAAEMRRDESAGVAPRPMFLYHAFQNAHVPLEVRPEDLAKFAPNASEFRDARIYRTMVGVADEIVGEVVAALKASSMWDDSLVIVMADNGAPTGPPDPFTGSNWPLRGGKYSYFEGGIRTAALVTGGLVPPAQRGTKRDAIVHSSDWYATIARLAGILDADYVQETIAGAVDQWPLIANGDVSAPRDEVLLGVGNGKSGAMRVGRYKLLMSEQEPNEWTGPHSPNGTKAGSTKPGPCKHQPCVFDLEADPGEHRDLSATQPDLLASLVERYQNATAGVGPFEHEPPEESLAWRDGYHHPVSSDVPAGCIKMRDNGFWWAPWDDADRSAAL